MSFGRFCKGVISDFQYIDKNIPDIKQQDKYYQKCTKDYSEISKRKNKKDIIEWSIRLRKTFKEILTSSLFYVESNKCLEYGLLSSYYYLRYYSLFHAMLGDLFLDKNQSIEELMKINHSKVVRCFTSNFCTKRFPIINSNIEEDFYTLQYMREYYSYSMPMNEIFNYDKDANTKVDLNNDIMSCFQLANFLSICITNSFNKNFGIYTKPIDEDMYYFIETFKLVNGKHAHNSGEIILDDADNNAFIESIKDGVSIEYLQADIDYKFDEFRSYNLIGMQEKQEKIYDEITSEVINIVYKALV